MSATADYFRIDVEDRLALSNEIRLRPDEIGILLAEGIPEARNFPVFRFFLNDFSTRTQGLDLLWSYASGPTRLAAAWNHTVTEIGNLRTSVIDQFRVQTLEQGLPNTRWNVSAEYSPDPWSLLGRVHWYGSYWGQRRRAERPCARALPRAVELSGICRQGARGYRVVIHASARA